MPIPQTLSGKQNRCNKQQNYCTPIHLAEGKGQPPRLREMLATRWFGGMLLEAHYVAQNHAPVVDPGRRGFLGAGAGKAHSSIGRKRGSVHVPVRLTAGARGIQRVKLYRYQ